MRGSSRLRLFPYYLNSRRLGLLAGVDFDSEVQDSLLQNSGDRVQAMRDVAHAADHLLQTGAIPSLTEFVVQKDMDDGERVLGFVWGVFTFSGAADASIRAQKGKSPKPARLKARIPLADVEYDLAGEMHIEHFYSTTSGSVLSGRKRMLVAGHFEFHGQRVDVFPYIIGEQVEATGVLSQTFAATIRIYPQQIDAFQRVATAPNPTDVEIAAIASMPESSVKAGFCRNHR